MSDIQPQADDQTPESLFEQAMAKIHSMEAPPQPPTEPEPTSEPTPPVPPTEPTEPTSEPTPPAEPTPEPGEPTPPAEPTADDNLITLGEIKLSKEDAKRYYEFEQFLKANPGAADGINRYLATYTPGQPPPAPTPPPEPELPEFIDKEDPQTQYLISELQSLRQQQAQLIALQQQRAEQENLAAYNRARDSWNSSYNFSPEELAKIEQTGADLGIMGGMIVNQRLTIEQATAKTLDVALRSLPEVYDRYIAERTNSQRQADNERVKADQERQKKLGALAGRTGATSVPTPPATKADVRQAMVNDFATAMSETT